MGGTRLQGGLHRNPLLTLGRNRRGAKEQKSRIGLRLLEVGGGIWRIEMCSLLSPISGGYNRKGRQMQEEEEGWGLQLLSWNAALTQAGLIFTVVYKGSREVEKVSSSS